MDFSNIADMLTLLKLRLGTETEFPDWVDTVSTDVSRLWAKDRRDFVEQSVASIESGDYDITLVNRSLDRRIEPVITAYQILEVRDIFAPEREEAFLTYFLHTILPYGSNDCHRIVESYLTLTPNKYEQRFYFFSVDIGKYFCGYIGAMRPDRHPCLNSYLSDGIPRELKPRNDVTAAALLIQPHLHDLGHRTRQHLISLLEAVSRTDT